MTREEIEALIDERVKSAVAAERVRMGSAIRVAHLAVKRRGLGEQGSDVDVEGTLDRLQNLIADAIENGDSDDDQVGY